MRTYLSDTAELTEEYGIRIGRWTNYKDLLATPFDAMWCEIPAGGSSDEDCHPEVEFAVVVRGNATYESGGDRVEVPTGGVIVLSPEEKHVIHNASAQDPLTILSIYWLPSDDAADKAGDASDGTDRVNGVTPDGA